MGCHCARGRPWIYFTFYIGYQVMISIDSFRYDGCAAKRNIITNIVKIITITMTRGQFIFLFIYLFIIIKATQQDEYLRYSAALP